MFELIGRAHAQFTSLPTLTPLNSGSFSGIVLMIINWVLILAAALAIIYLVYGGIMYITAGGDAEKATKGRTAVVNAIIGIVIILLAFLLVTWVNSIVNNQGA
jgi:hypothetical protein